MAQDSPQAQSQEVFLIKKFSFFSTSDAELKNKLAGVIWLAAKRIASFSDFLIVQLVVIVVGFSGLLLFVRFLLPYKHRQSVYTPDIRPKIKLVYTAKCLIFNRRIFRSTLK